MVRPDALFVTVGGKTTVVQIEKIVEMGDGGTMGLLLWGLLLTLKDLETDFRRALDRSEIQVAQASAFAQNPGAIVGQVLKALQEIGLPIPEPPQRPSEGNG